MNEQARQRGTTLIELSVVIAVLLLLVGVLFIGVTAWKTSANTAACIINLASVQKAARGYQNMNGLATSARAPGNYFNGRRVLDDVADVSDRSCLHIHVYRTRFRSILRNLPRCRSRTVGDSS